MLWTLGILSCLCMLLGMQLRSAPKGILGAILVGELGTLAGGYVGYQLAISPLPTLRVLGIALIATALITPVFIYLGNRLAIVGIALHALLTLAANSQF